MIVLGVYSMMRFTYTMCIYIYIYLFGLSNGLSWPTNAGYNTERGHSSTVPPSRTNENTKL